MAIKRRFGATNSDFSTKTEMEEVYSDGKFQARGFSKVEFMRLYDLAERVTLPSGQVLVKEGQVKRSLHFLLDGQVRVSTARKQGEGGEEKTLILATLDRYHFIGEISLLSRMIADGVDSAASADVTVVGDSTGAGATFLKWDFAKLEPYLKEDREVFNALSAYFNYDLTAKLLRDGQIQKASTTGPSIELQQEQQSQQPQQPQSSQLPQPSLQAQPLQQP